MRNRWTGKFTTQRSGAERTEIDGHKFGSKGEASRYQELRLMDMAGEITDLEVHPRYDLVIGGQTLRGPGGRKMSIELDFSYRDREGKPHLEDYKGREEGDEYRLFWLKKQILEATTTDPKTGLPLVVEVVK